MGASRFSHHVVAVGVLALILTAGDAIQVLAADKIKMSSRSTFWDLVLIESGAAKKYNLAIELVRMKSGPEVTEALVGGSVDVGSIGETPLTSLLTRTANVVGVIGTAVSTNGSYAKVIVPKKSGFKSIEDLKGKKIATKVGSGSFRALSDWCRKTAKCSLSDFRITNTAPGAIVAALQAGSVDAGIWFAPVTTIATAKGFGRILMDFKGANQGQASWVVNRAYAKKNPDVVARFLAATIDAQQILVKDPARAAKLIERGMQKRGRDLTADILEPGIAAGDFDYRPSMDVDRKVAVFNAVFDSLKANGKLQGDRPDFSKGLLPAYHKKAEALAAKSK